VSSNSRSQDSIKPQYCCHEKGHEGVVKLLVQLGDINPTTADTKYGRTPLLWAIERGNEGVVKLLLEHGDLDPDIPCPNGQTASDVAESREHAGIVRLLWQHKPSSLTYPQRGHPSRRTQTNTLLQKPAYSSDLCCILVSIVIAVVSLAGIIIMIYRSK